MQTKNSICSSTVSLPLDETNNKKTYQLDMCNKTYWNKQMKKVDRERYPNRFPNMANGQIELSVILFIHNKSNFG